MKKVKVLEYQVVFQEETTGGYSAWVPDLNGCASQGETLEETIENIKEAIELYLEDEDINKYEQNDKFIKQFVVPIKVNAKAS